MTDFRTKVKERTNQRKDGYGPAFPTEPRGPVYGNDYDGMTLRAYAAIQLRQPNSGIDWLDDMIRNAQRDDLAGQALAGPCATNGDVPAKTYAAAAYYVSDAMIKAQEDTKS